MVEKGKKRGQNLMPLHKAWWGVFFGQMREFGHTTNMPLNSKKCISRGIFPVLYAMISW